MFPEVRAILLRKAIGARGFICARELLILLEFLGDWLSIERSRLEPDGRYERRADGGAQLVLPITPDDSVEVRTGVHEVGHAVLDLPPVERLDQTGALIPEALAEQLEHRDEAECHVFSDALRLPRHKVRAYLGCEYPDWAGLIEDSQCTREEIERRLAWMKLHEAPRIPHPPSWSAWHQYRLLEQGNTKTRSLVVAPLSGAGPEIILPYRSPREYRELREQVCASLAALRPHEFRLKYGADRFTRCELFVHWEEWCDSVQLIEEHF